METFIYCCSFTGSWLLFAGSIYQAAMELKDEKLANQRIRLTAKSVGKPDRASAWWWLLPPVKVELERRNNRKFRAEVIKTLPQEDLEAMVSYISKAIGWQFVALGGLLIAFQETYQLTRILHLRVLYFWLITLGLILICLIYNVYQVNKGEKYLKQT